MFLVRACGVFVSASLLAVPASGHCLQLWASLSNQDPLISPAFLICGGRGCMRWPSPRVVGNGGAQIIRTACGSVKSYVHKIKRRWIYMDKCLMMVLCVDRRLGASCLIATQHAVS